MSGQNTEVSKLLSYILRHMPQSIGLKLDNEGWANIGELINCANQSGKMVSHELIQQVVESSDKKRFSISTDGLSIRAAQGHSTESVSITYAEKIPPALLYHGTATRFLESIEQQGLLAGQRQHVHLSEDMQTAIAVGQRYGKPVVLTIDVLQMHQQGFKFYQSDNGVWLTEKVPTEFILN